MKRLFDATCTNNECDEIEVIELFSHVGEDFPPCKVCGVNLTQTHTKTASFEISGGGVYSPGKSYNTKH